MTRRAKNFILSSEAMWLHVCPHVRFLSGRWQNHAPAPVECDTRRLWGKLLRIRFGVEKHLPPHWLRIAARHWRAAYGAEAGDKASLEPCPLLPVGGGVTHYASPGKPDEARVPGAQPSAPGGGCSEAKAQ